MSLRLREIPLDLDENEDVLPSRLAALLGLDEHLVTDVKVVRRGIDARKKNRVLKVFTLEFTIPGEDAFFAAHQENQRLEKVLYSEPPSIFSVETPHKALVVGMGPAGLFAALRLALSGVCVTLIEQGEAVEKRVLSVRKFWEGLGLNPQSNIQFGEGGAGTFSDGKLTTRVNHPWTRLVLQTLVDFGAPEDILVQAKPHIGTDRLRLVLLNFRKKLLALGVDIRFECRLSAMEMDSSGKVVAGVVNDSEVIACDSLVLAPGHSARQTYAMLEKQGVALEAKPFAIGVRVEHPTETIDKIQYGFSQHLLLPAADYSLSFNDADTGRGIYSFCMCPGGVVVNASSEPASLVVNGMSYLKRAGELSNSALVVSVRPEDFHGRGTLAGVRFQQSWERAAYRAGGSNDKAPAQNLMAFLGKKGGPIHSSCRPGVQEADLKDVLPAFVVQGLEKALPYFDRRMKGFVTAEATLVGVETRTSAPVRIPRRDSGESLFHPGLYPAGEGAGYAGGIMSAALDGLKAAEWIIDKVTDRRNQE